MQKRQVTKEDTQMVKKHMKRHYQQALKDQLYSDISYHTCICGLSQKPD